MQRRYRIWPLLHLTCLGEIYPRIALCLHMFHSVCQRFDCETLCQSCNSAVENQTKTRSSATEVLELIQR
jgi:hypothetical protein